VIWHPFTWAFGVAGITGTLLYTAGAWQAMDVALSWSPARADAAQLHREIRAETAALLGRWSLGCLAAAAAMGLIGIAVIWPHMIPGAMCGTGVLQAMGANGSRAVIYWGAALVILYGWHVLDHLDRFLPRGVLTRSCARVMIIAAPFLVLALFHTWQALGRIDTAPAVSCCAAVYDRVLNERAAGPALAGFIPIALWGSLAGSVALLVAALIKIRFPLSGSGAPLAVMAIGWAIGAGVCVKQVWSAYYYQVLSHPCPWCLFLPDYDGAGFFIFGSIAMVSAECMALGLADRVRRQHAALAGPAARRIRHAAWRIVSALAIFIALTVGPAVFWRIRTGVWLSGSP
jgi:hypothetical protein